MSNKRIARKKIGITVSKNYHDELKISIEHNAKHFDEWHIITQSDDTETIKIIEESEVKNINTVLFPLVPAEKSLLSKLQAFFGFRKANPLDLKACLDEYNKPMDDADLFISRPWGKHTEKPIRQPLFEKGLAMRYVQKHLLEHVNDEDLIICMDTDIILPPLFGKKLKNVNFTSNTLYGCKRKEFLFLEDFTEDKNTFLASTPWHVGAGFLQIYLGLHRKEKLMKRTMTCGWTDWEFKSQFNDIEELPLVVAHLGADSLNWKGKRLKTFYIDKKSSEDKIKISKRIRKAKEKAKEKKEKKEKKALENFKAPEFVIAGFQKCGTTALREMLKQHPDIEMPDSHDPSMKYSSEIDYFSKRHNLGKSWYMSHFPDDGKIYGHKSPNSTQMLPRPWTTKVAASRMVTDAPDIKIILLMRDPVEREFSAYCHYRTKRWNQADEYDFIDYVKNEVPHKHRNLFFTNYYSSASCFYNMFTDKKIHLISQENLLVNHDEEFARLFNFLSVSNYKIEQLNSHSGIQHYKKEETEFTEEARDILIKKYKSVVDKISKNLPIDTSLWKNFN